MVPEFRGTCSELRKRIPFNNTKTLHCRSHDYADNAEHQMSFSYRHKIMNREAMSRICCEMQKKEKPVGRRPNQHEAQTSPGGVFAFRIIFSFTRASHLIFLVPAFLLAALSGLFLPIMSILIGRFFNSFAQYSAGVADGEKLTKDTLPTLHALLGVAAGIWVVKGGFCCAWMIYGESQAQAVREDLFSALLLRDLAWFAVQQTGVDALLSRIQTQVRDFQLGVSHPLGLATLSVCQSITSLGVAFYHSWELTLVMLATFPVIAFALSFLSRGLQQAIQRQQSELTKATKQAGNAISNLTILKCHNTQTIEATTYAEILSAVSWHFRAQARIVATQTGLMRVAATSLLVLALFFGNHLIHDADASPGTVITTFCCSVTASKGFNEILTQILVLEKGKIAAKALCDLLQQVHRGNKLSDEIHCQALSNLEGDIEFRQVEFSYPTRPDQKVLRDVTLFFPAHETTFVVGKSGSGKSTLSALLLKFYAPSGGKITIDGKDVQKLDTNWLRNNVTLVQQDSILFNGTVSDNITICNDGSSRVATIKVSECLTFSELEDTIQSLPQGVDTKVGKGGMNLSGGQRQKTALARARLRDTPVLVLDESTSALDEMGKVCVMRNIRQWRQEKTTIIITHDLSQIQSGDFVYVLKDGEVITEGYRSAVKAKLEDDQHLDMIGSPLTPLLEDTAQSTSARARIMHGLRPQPMHTRSNASMSSMDSTGSESIAGSETNLLLTSDTGQTGPRTARMSVRAFLQRRTLFDNEQPIGSRINLTDQELDLDYEMSQVSSIRKVHNRLTMARAARPLTTHPTLTLRPTYQPEDVAPSLLARPITVWDDSAGVVSEIRAQTDENIITAHDHETLSFRQILLTVWPALGKRDRSWLVVALTAAAAYAAIPSVVAWVVVQLYETFLQHEGWVQEARKWSLILVAIGCADGATAYTIHYLFETLGQALITAVRQKAFAQILLQPKSWIDSDQYSTIGMCNILDTAAEELRDLLARFISFALIAVMMVLASIIWSLTTCWKVTLVALACTPTVYAVTKMLSVVSTRWESRSVEAAERTSDIFAEGFSDVRTVRSLSLESHFHKKYVEAASQAFMTGQRRGIFVGLCFGLSDSSVPLVTACIFVYGMTIAKSGEFTTQAVNVTWVVLLFSMMGASSILGFIPQLSARVNAGNRILRLANLPSESHESRLGERLLRDDFSGNIQFKQVHFSYPSRPDAIVLKDMDLAIQAGQHIAVVGRSGCGKSTIISLILGLYPIFQGSLNVSGHGMQDLELSALRSLIAYVPQQPVLFATTIRQNILYGLETQTTSEHLDLMHTAAHSAGIHDFITSLPSAYETLVGDGAGGTGLSGGQSQRIVLARAFARNPKILLMDEPTSALDVESAEVIRDSIRRLRRVAARHGGAGPTVVVVTHAREMMEVADRVVVVGDGKVVEEGSFETLMGSRGQLWRLLNGEGVEEDIE